MADTVTPQGFVAVCRQFPTVGAGRVRRGRRASSRSSRRCATPATLGTIIRAADAAGADAVVLTGRTVDLYNPKVVRATTGSLFHLPVAVGVELGDVARPRPRGGRARCSRPTSRATTSSPPRDGVLAEPTAWLFGNEARGLDDEQLALADRVAHGADLRQRRVDEPRHRGVRLPLRERLRAALRRVRLTIPSCYGPVKLASGLPPSDAAP